MQTPERLALIGGGILLSSTLIFTLKSQASQILPKIEHPIESIYGHISDTQGNDSVNFDSNFQQAQKNGWKTGTWGSAKYYIDDQHNMYVGSGKLDGVLNLVLGKDTSNQLRTINFEEPVQAPQDSDSLLQANYWTNNTLTSINGLEKMDTSQVTNMDSIFANDTALTNINVSNWDTSNVTNMHSLFFRNLSLKELDLSRWNTPKLTLANWMFSGDTNLDKLNIQNMDTTNANMDMFFVGNENNGSNDHLSNITLGDKTYLKNWSGINGVWTNGQQNISGFDLNSLTTSNGSTAHAGNWHRIN